MTIDCEGFANFIIGDDTPKMAAKAKVLGANFMPWKAGNKMLMIYRHMLPNADFAHGIHKVKPFDPKLPAADQVAIKTIGQYAMIGKMIESTGICSLSGYPNF